MAGQATDSTYKSHVCRPLVGGLEASMPPHMLGPSESPDLLNVVLNNNGVEKRGGFVPLTREHPRLSSIKNRGHHARARIQNTGTAADSNILIVPGCAYAGHRQIYETLNLALAVEMFCRIDDLTTEHVGNQRGNALDEVYYTANDTTPFTIKVRPILSKGPAKRWYDADAVNGPAENNQIQWRIPASPGGTSYWGPGVAEASMPFCIYLYNNAGNWEFRVSWHSVLTGTNQFELLTIRIPFGTLAPRTDVTYHLIFSMQHGLSATFRVGVFTDRISEPTYYSSSSIINTGGGAVTFSNYRAPASFTTGPIQLFDCPQEFIEAPTAVSTARPPGLALSGATDGGYWFACTRFEGSVEDVAIWSTHKLLAGATTLDRGSKLDLSAQAQTDIVSYWSMAEPGMQFVREMTGRGNHLYFIPAGPIYDNTLGSPRSGTKACWWLNGQTSYIKPDLDYRPSNTVADATAGYSAFQEDGHPNWRYRIVGPAAVTDVPSREVSFYQRMVLGNYGHGIEVTFWADSIEPRFEQVIMEVHGVLRLVIDVDGKLTGYCRNDATGASLNYLYQATGGGGGHNHLASGFLIEPGRRYTVALYRDTGGTTLRMIVNGVQVASTSVVANSANGWLVGGITIGMGSVTLNGYTDSLAGAYPTTGTPPSPNQINIDPRSGFIGRVESARLLGGEYTSVPNYKHEDVDDYRIAQKGLWNTPSAGSESILQLEAESGEEYSANLSPGHGLVTGGKLVPFIDRFLIPRDYVAIYGNTNTNSNYGIAPGVALIQSGGFVRDPAGSENGYGVRHGGVKTYHTIARWVFDIDDQDAAYAGSYKNRVEAYISGATTLFDTYRSTHFQLSNVTDEVGTLSCVLKCCIESDHFSLQYRGTGFGTPFVSLRRSGRPYHYKAPTELAPTWAPGLARPLTGTNEIALIADWQHQQSNEKFLVVACDRQFYWAKPGWRNASPFVEPSPVSVWAFGQPDDHIKMLATHSQQEMRKSGANWSTLTVELWVHPQRLDGYRMIACKGDLSINQVNYAIGAIDGSLCVFGTSNTATATWAFREGTYTGATLYPRATLRANAWNHVYVLLGQTTSTGAGSATVQAWVNGAKVTMTLDPNLTALTAFPPDGANFPLYIGGVPEHQRTIAAPSFVKQWSSWCGFLSEFRSTNAEEAAFFSAANFGYPKRVRYSDSASTYYLIHLNEGEEWSVANSAAAGAGDHGTLHLRELIQIDTNAAAIDSSKGYTYDHIVFRDELIVTNGVSYPQRIQFTSFSDPKGPFRRYRLGVDAPFSVEAIVTPFGFTEPAPPATNPRNYYRQEGDYEIAVSFLTASGDESEPTTIARKTLTGTFTYCGFRVNYLPRSPDPQVVGRRIYVSAAGGGNPLFHSDIPDNETQDFQVYGPPAGDVVEVGTRLPAPKARHITVGTGTVFLGYLTESAAGSNAFTFNDPASISYFPFANQLLVDSENGKAITGFRAHLGTLFIMKRDSTWHFSLQGVGNPTEAGAYLFPVSESVGLPGGLVSFDNLLYGTGERGPYSFDGSNHVFLGRSLKDDYIAFNLTDESMLAIDGAFERPNSQYWLSMRQDGASYNEYCYVLHTNVGDRQQWTKLRLPKHTVLAGILLPTTQQQAIVIGTIHGQILRYASDVTIDGHGNTKQDNALTPLAGTVSSGTTTSFIPVLAIGSALDTVGDGLRGCTVQVNGLNRTIERNTSTTIYFRDALPGAASGDFLIGPFDSYWTSGWVDPQPYGRWLEARFLDLDFAASNTNLTIENHVAHAIPVGRSFPAGAETRNASLADGYLRQPLPVQTKNVGRYFRVRFSSNAQNDKWLVTGWGLRYGDAGVRGSIQ